MNRADYFVSIGKYAEAADDYQEVWNETSGFTIGEEPLLHHLAKEKWDQYSDYALLRFLNNLVERWNGSNSLPQRDRARLLCKLGKYQEALADYEILSTKCMPEIDDANFARCKEEVGKLINDNDSSDDEADSVFIGRYSI